MTHMGKITGFLEIERQDRRYEPAADGKIVPTVTGRAWVTAEVTLILQDDDPFRDGIR